MAKAIDLIGQRFGKLVVIERAKNHNGRTAWICKCDCGNTIDTEGSSLRRGFTKSCGCLAKYIRNKNNIDIIGKKFGRLLVLKRVDRPEHISIRNTHAYFLCKCDCGKEVVVISKSLYNGNTTSCGCYRKDVVSLASGEAAKNKLLGVYKRQAKNRGFIFDISDEYFLKLTEQNCFYCDSKPSNISGDKTANGTYQYNGIDRVDSNLGYIIGNIVPCCSLCNRCKMAMSREDFLSWVERVYNHSIKKE